jgi:ribonuclease HII
MSEPIQIEEMLATRGHTIVCGVDEVGRGPLAGPVVAAAVLYPLDLTIEGLDDSKKLSPAKREQVFEAIVSHELIMAVGILDNNCIDQINIHKAALLAMRKAVMDLKRAPEIVIVDGKHTIPKLDFPQFAVVGGDRLCKSVAAASIVAKVTRDRIMVHYEQLHPNFSFATHKGYPTHAHLDELKKHGACEIHRRSFKPVATLTEQLELV